MCKCFFDKEKEGFNFEARTFGNLFTSSDVIEEQLLLLKKKSSLSRKIKTQMRIIVHLICIYCLIFCFGCKTKFSNNELSTQKLTFEETKDSIQTFPNWILEFKRLRAALYQNNMDSLCTFFDFPLTKEQSEGLVAAVNFRATSTSGETIQIHTKQDFIEYSWQIFPTDYVKGLLPIKSDSLLKDEFLLLRNGNCQRKCRIFYFCFL